MTLVSLSLRLLSLSTVLMSSAFLVGCAGPIASFVLSVMAFNEVHHAGRVSQILFSWISIGPPGVDGSLSVPFGLTVDPLMIGSSPRYPLEDIEEWLASRRLQGK